MNKIKVLFLDVENAKEPEIIEINNQNTKDFKKLIGCNTINITQRSFGGKTYCVVADDVGLFKENKKLSVFSHNVYERIYGNVIIANFDGCEDLESLTSVDLIRILSCKARYVTDKAYPVLKAGNYN